MSTLVLSPCMRQLPPQARRIQTRTCLWVCSCCRCPVLAPDLLRLLQNQPQLMKRTTVESKHTPADTGSFASDEDWIGSAESTATCLSLLQNSGLLPRD